MRSLHLVVALAVALAAVAAGGIASPLAAQRGSETITLLLRKPVVTDEAGLTRLAAKAFGVPLDKWNTGNEAPHFVVFDSKPKKKTGGEEPTEPGRPDNVAVIKSSGRIVLLSFFATPALADPKQAAKGHKDLRVRKALREHRAWMSLILRGPDGEAAAAISRRFACRLAAGFVPDNAVALQFGEERTYHPVVEGTVEALRDEAPRAAVRRVAKVPVISGEDNPELDAAIAEAKKRFGEFAAAFRAEKGDAFFVKFPFTEGEFTEHIWLAVTKIAGDKVTGRVGNDPVDLKKVKAGHVVTRKSADCSDWLIVAGGEMVGGGFTVKVLQKQAAERARSGQQRGEGKGEEKRKDGAQSKNKR